jgi:hypothetical protein
MIPVISKFTASCRQGLLKFREETGQSLVLWAIIAMTSLFTQVFLHHELLPGEFGTFNTALGVIGLMMVPLVALCLAFNWHAARKQVPGEEARLQNLRASELIVTETFTWVWALVASVLVLFILQFLALPRYTLTLFTQLNVVIALGALLSVAMYRSRGQLRDWASLYAGTALARLLLCIALAWYVPWSESGLAAFLFAGLITIIPALRTTETGHAQRIQALKTTVMDRVFLLDLGAIFSVFLAIFLFTNADRIVAQSWFGTVGANDVNADIIDWPMFDAYQTAGLLARSILWGTQPLLLILFLRRARIDRTTSAVMDWFWLYLGLLVTGVTFIDLFDVPLSQLFCGRDYVSTAHLVPGFTLTMIPLGLLQGVGIFGLASRRYIECFIFGACGIAYTLLLYGAGRHPQLMLAYMFGGGLISLMMVLFVGVVRWGRRQP